MLTCTVRTEPVTFKYNGIYGEQPSEITDQAWENLFPEQGGFFKHPDLAPMRSALSVFHQLHCLVRWFSLLVEFPLIIDDRTASARLTGLYIEPPRTVLKSPQEICQ